MQHWQGRRLDWQTGGSRMIPGKVGGSKKEKIFPWTKEHVVPICSTHTRTHAAAAVERWDRQTDGQVPTQRYVDHTNSSVVNNTINLWPLPPLASPASYGALGHMPPPDFQQFISFGFTLELYKVRRHTMYIPLLLKLVYFSYYWKNERVYRIFLVTWCLSKPYLCYFTYVTKHISALYCARPHTTSWRRHCSPPHIINHT